MLTKFKEVLKKKKQEIEQNKWHKKMYKTNRSYQIWYRAVHHNTHPFFKRGCGYYLNVSSFDTMATEFINSPGLWDKTSIEDIAKQTKKSIYDTIWEPKVSNGRIAVTKLHSYQKCRDPYDMIESSKWAILGYKGCKPIKECTWEEYQQLYNLI